MRKYFIAGLLVWLPILATYFVIKFLIDLLDNSLALIPNKYQPDQLLGFHIPGLGLIFTLVIIFLTGLLVANILGKRLVELYEKLVAKIPLIRSIHAAVKQVAHTLLQPHERAFRKVLLIEYPRRGVWSVGFLTSTQFTDAPIEEDVVTVFIPTTPNPTSGFLTIVPKHDTIELDISVEEALRMIISVGVVMPERMQQNHNSKQKEQAQPQQT